MDQVRIELQESSVQVALQLMVRLVAVGRGRFVGVAGPPGEPPELEFRGIAPTTMCYRTVGQGLEIWRPVEERWEHVGPLTLEQREALELLWLLDGMQEG